MPISFEQLAKEPPQPVDWVVGNWLTRGNTGFIMGEPKRASKSWLVLALCWDLSEGKGVWGIKTTSPHSGDGAVPAEAMKASRPMRCVYFTQEDTKNDIYRRVMAHVSRGRREPNDRLWVVPKNLQLKLDTLDGRSLVQRELDEVRDKAGAIDLVVFDPMRRIHNGNENDSSTIAALWGVIDRIHQRYGCATLVTHHIKKPPTDRTDYDPTDMFNGRGSGDIYGGGDAFVMVVPGETDNRTYRRVAVHFESKREAPAPPSELKVSFETGQVRFLGAAQVREAGDESII
jgi:RecA-family ATPase